MALLLLLTHQPPMPLHDWWRMLTAATVTLLVYISVLLVAIAANEARGRIWIRLGVFFLSPLAYCLFSRRERDDEDDDT
jgi:hypothetical protein